MALRSVATKDSAELHRPVQGVAVKEADGARPKRSRKASEEQATLTRFGGTRKAVPRGAYREVAEPEYFERRAEVRDAIRSTLELAMKARGVTQKELATVMGLSHSAVRHRMNGRTVFSADEIAVVAEKLGIDVRAFLDPDMTHREVLAHVKRTPES